MKRLLTILALGILLPSTLVAEPYDLSGFTIPFAYTWPTPPTTTSVIHVPADMEFSAAVQVDGAQVIVAPGYSGAGISSGFGDDIDIIMDNTATITTAVSFGAAQRVRWTGGNVTEGMVATGWADILIDNVSVFSSTTNTALTAAFKGAPLNRVALINSTFRGSGGWGLTVWGDETFMPTHNNLIIANCLFSSDNYQGTRINSVNDLIIVDSFARDQLATGGASWRFHHNNTDVFMENTVGRGHTLSIPVGGDPGPGVVNGTINNHHQFNVNANTGQFWITNGSSNTGTITNSKTHYEGGAGSFGVPTNFKDGGGNSRVAWDGATIDYSELPGKNSISDYGADH